MFLLLSFFAHLNAKRPNIVFMIADDLGWTDISINGAEYETPVLDRMLSDGVDFKNFYTLPVCSPTRTSLMTGRYPFRMGLQAMTTFIPGTTAHIPMEEKTFAEQLKEIGYTNSYLGKWHLGYDKWDHTPLGRGYDYFTGLLQGGGDFYLHNVTIGTGAINFNGYDFWLNKDLDFSVIGRHTNDVLIERAFEKFEEAAESKKPFLTTIAFQQIHAPNQNTSAAREDVTSHCDSNTAIKTERRRILCKMVATLDDAIGQIEQKLSDLGLLDDTLIIFTTDNGGMTFNDFACDYDDPDTDLEQLSILCSISSNMPMRAGKATLFEGGVKGVAFLAGGALPEEYRGKTLETLHHVADLPVTAMKSAGANVPPNVDGVDILGGESHEAIFLNIAPEITALGQTLAPLEAVIAGQHKYQKAHPLYDGWYDEGYLREAPNDVADVDGCAEGCVFDLSNDPNERAPNSTFGYRAIAVEIQRMIQDVKTGGDYIDMQDGFLNVNISAFGIWCWGEGPRGHRRQFPVHWPYLEPLPKECQIRPLTRLNLGPLRRFISL